MNRHSDVQQRRTIGQVHPGTMLDLTPESLEKRMKRQQIDARVQNIGRSFRSVIDSFRVHPVGETANPNVNRRAGQTFLIATATALALASTLTIAEIATPDKKVCVEKSSGSDRKWNDISRTAQELRDQGVFVAENTQLYDAWDNSGPICMVDRQGPLAGIIDVIASDMATNS